MFFIASGPYGDPISPIVVEVSAQTAERLHVKIYDPNNQRWEVPDKYMWNEYMLLIAF